jgi:uncharacterized membrane protein
VPESPPQIGNQYFRTSSKNLCARLWISRPLYKLYKQCDIPNSLFGVNYLTILQYKELYKNSGQQLHHNINRLFVLDFGIWKQQAVQDGTCASVTQAHHGWHAHNIRRFQSLSSGSSMVRQIRIYINVGIDYTILVK